ncbi:hypothetical protein [Nostoc sp.]
MRSHLDDEESKMGWQVSLDSRGNLFELWRSLLGVPSLLYT